MSSQTLPTLALSLGSILLNHVPITTASEISHSSIVQATQQRHDLLNSDRQLQSSYTTNPALTTTQYDNCISDMKKADKDNDAQLSKSEFLRFVSYNSARSGSSWGYSANQRSMDQLPLEFLMLFHSTACQCAYEQVFGADFGCCQGDKGTIKVPAEDSNDGYTRMFCTDAYYAYEATFMPSKSPTPQPSDGPSKSPTPQPSGSPTMAPVTGTPTESDPTPEITDSPTTSPVEETVDSPTVSPTKAATMPPSMKPVTASPTKAPVTASPTEAGTMPPSLTTKAPVSALPTTTSPVAVPVKLPTISPVGGGTTSASPTASPVKGASAFPTLNPIATTVTDNPTESPVIEQELTDPPTFTPTISPTDVVTNRPTVPPASEPVPSTESPTTPSPTTPAPIVTDLPTPSPFTPIPTEMPTRSPVKSWFSPTDSPTTDSTTTATTNSPTRSLEGDILEISHQYGISSTCGMSAYDVFNDSYGITIREGLIFATEFVVIDTLNATYPRDGSAPLNEVPQLVSGAPIIPIIEEDILEFDQDGTGGSGDDNNDGARHSKASSSTKILKGKGPVKSSSMHAHGMRVRVEGFPYSPNNGNHRNLAALHAKEHAEGLEHLRFRDEHHRLPHLTAKQVERLQRKLVYYTQDNPVVITDIEDVYDQSCPFGLNCMRVSSTISLTLEAGDNPQEIEAVIRNGLQISLNAGTFFNGLPSDTIFCPPPPTQPPKETASPTLSPVAVPTTSAPTAASPVVTSGAPTLSPVSNAPTAAPTTYIWPTYSPTSFRPTTDFPSPLPSSEPSSYGGSEVIPFTVSLTYDFSLDCGLDAQAIMEGEGGNTVKEGLEAATTTITIDILNSTFPRVEEEPTRMRRNVRRRQLARLDMISVQQQQHRNLVYYTDSVPVTIDRIIDITTGCAPGSDCMLVSSTITIMLEPGDEQQEVKKAINDGLKKSFADGSFFGAVPEDTVICPT